MKSKMNAPDKDLNSRTLRLWTYLFERKGMFQIWEDMTKAIADVTLDEFKMFFKEKILNNQMKLSIVYGNETIDGYSQTFDSVLNFKFNN